MCPQLRRLSWVWGYLTYVHSGRKMCVAKTSILVRVNMLNKRIRKSSYSFVCDVFTLLNLGLESMIMYTIHCDTKYICQSSEKFLYTVCPFNISGCIMPLWAVLQISEEGCFMAALELQIFCIYVLKYLTTLHNVGKIRGGWQNKTNIITFKNTVSQITMNANPQQIPCKDQNQQCQILSLNTLCLTDAVHKPWAHYLFLLKRFFICTHSVH